MADEKDLKHLHEDECECDCCCGHDHEHEAEEEDMDLEHVHSVIMENEDGTTEEYPIADEFELDGIQYLLVENEDGTVTPLRVAGEEGELEFLDEEEFNAVADAYNMALDMEEEEESKDEE